MDFVHLLPMAAFLVGAVFVILEFRKAASEENQVERADELIEEVNERPGKEPEVVGMALLGLLMLISGLAGLFFFFLVYDISVDTGLGNRVINLSLASNRQAGLIASGFVAVIGALLLMVGKSSHRGDS